MTNWAVTVFVGFVLACILGALGTPVWLTVILLGIFFSIEAANNR